jgi:hypothetical protein
LKFRLSRILMPDIITYPIAVRCGDTGC